MRTNFPRELEAPEAVACIDKMHSNSAEDGGVEAGITSETTVRGDDFASVKDAEHTRRYPATAGASQSLLTCEYTIKCRDLH